MSISDACGLRRIYFYAGRGVAQAVWDRPAMELKVAPDLGFPFVEIDYEPAAKCFQVRRKERGELVEMTAAERKACSEFLDKL